ncbi:mechanosensitive ion channel family protein [Haloplanus aerogenes]|uniref:Mechanosensitive ion channel family protein n=1 Tax=Haloplanus aerogenes TaxID=660522 RepID=A0A3M0D2Y8_9EURY|nr:mechanosensitive ion channel family protein [Haloplanus aerogenes]AZH25215.1 mechanosensitive ion channel family protein [Haloplanus aerogenes]RMB13556.1 mechanosensitive ion channel-like protein [Haloplanus aerogenes]
MANLLAIADGSTVGRTVATLLVVAAVLAVRFGARRWRRGRESTKQSLPNVTVSALVTLATGGGIIAVVLLWDLIGPLQRSYRSLGLEDIAGRVLLSVVILATTYALTGFVGRVIGEFTGQRSTISEHQREIIYRLTQVSLYTLAVLVVVGLFTQNLGSLIVGAGFLGIVVGMAARQTLGAALAGFVLMFSRPFEIGDWVEIGDREGIVTEITIVTTRIQTFDGEYVMLPNDEVSGQPITNRTRKGRLRIEVEVGVDYDHDPERAAEIARETVRGLDEVLQVPTPQVVGKRFGDSAIVLGVRVWIDNPSSRRMWRARTAVIEAVTDAFEEEGIKIPFPQRELMGRTEEGGFAIAESADRAAPTPDGGGDGDE